MAGDAERANGSTRRRDRAAWERSGGVQEPRYGRGETAREIGRRVTESATWRRWKEQAAFRNRDTAGGNSPGRSSAGSLVPHHGGIGRHDHSLTNASFNGRLGVSSEPRPLLSILRGGG